MLCICECIEFHIVNNTKISPMINMKQCELIETVMEELHHKTAARHYKAKQYTARY